MCLVLPFCGVLAILKNKKVWPLFHCKSSIVVLSIYIRTLFYFKNRKNKKESQGNKNNNLTLRKMFIAGLELTTADSRGQRANHCAMKDLTPIISKDQKLVETACLRFWWNLVQRCLLGLEPENKYQFSHIDPWLPWKRVRWFQPFLYNLNMKKSQIFTDFARKYILLY